MSVKEHLYLLLLIFKQEKLFGRAWEGNLGSRRIFLTVLVGHKKKTLSGPLFAHPCSTPNVPGSSTQRWKKPQRTANRSFKNVSS
jgi:hypothetical protein